MKLSEHEKNEAIGKLKELGEAKENAIKEIRMAKNRLRELKENKEIINKEQILLRKKL